MTMHNSCKPVKPDIVAPPSTISIHSPLYGWRHEVPFDEGYEIDGWAHILEMTTRGYDARRHGDEIVLILSEHVPCNCPHCIRTL